MKKTLLLLAAAMITFGAAAQSEKTADQLRREFRQTVQKRDASHHWMNSKYPLSTQPVQDYPLIESSATKLMPPKDIWFPGEWEEVKAIVVTPYYDYLVPGHENDYYWMADPLVTGVADYYQYTYRGWTEQGTGPYSSEMDTSSDFGKVFFYLMDGIQLGGAEAWVRIEQPEDSAKVIRTLTRMNLRHSNVRFIVGPGNSFWYRDCGPICFYYGDQDSLAMLDFTYYPGRALDDSLPTLIEQQMGIPDFLTRIEWEGGNCLVDGAGMVFSSNAIYETNSDTRGQLTWDGVNINTIAYSRVPALGADQVKDALHRLLGQRATYILPAYQYDGGTGHIDLYADAWDENGFVFSIMPEVYRNWVDYTTGQRNIDSLCSYKSIFDRNYYMMGDIPFPSKDNGGNFSSQVDYDNNYTRTYSNHTFVNNVILQPCFSEVQDGQPSADWDRENLEALKAAYPGYTIYPVDVREFDGSGGAIHCVTKQIPADNPVRILHKNIHGDCDALRNSDIPVSAIITNRGGISHAEAIYRVDSGDWHTVNLTANGNRYYGVFPFGEIGGTVEKVEYYLSATTNNGKTITKPMTATQGGYYSFSFANDGNTALDSTMFDFSTDPMPKENITFAFGSRWATNSNGDTLGIQRVEVEGNFGQFYPNPAADMAFLDINMADGGTYAVSIVDAAGRTVHTSTLQAAGTIRYSINASRLASGMYTVVFTGQNCRVARKLIVK